MGAPWEYHGAHLLRAGSVWGVVAGYRPPDTRNFAEETAALLNLQGLISNQRA